MSKQTITGNSRIGIGKLSTNKFGNAFLDAPKRITEKRIQLRPGGKVPNGGFIEVGSVEDGEEVEQGSPDLLRFREGSQDSEILRSTVETFLYADLRNVLGKINFHACISRKTHSSYRELGKRLAAHGISLSEDCANLLNVSLEVFLKRLIRAGTDLARARHNRSDLVNSMNYSASLLDFKVAVESKPELLGPH